MTERVGDWIQTFTGKRFYPLDPRLEDIDIRDIAHALSMQCRYAGHCNRYYSVAEHSVLLSRFCEAEGRMAARWALLHDASEAYILDVPRPLKPYLVNYKGLEAAIMDVVAIRFGLYSTMPAEVKRADDRILADEVAQNLGPLKWDYEPGPKLGVALQFWSPAEAEAAFLRRFDEVGVA